MHLAGTKKPYLFRKMAKIYTNLRTDCIYSGIFIHTRIIPHKLVFIDIYYTLLSLWKTTCIPVICIDSGVRSINRQHMGQELRQIIM